VIEQLGRGSMGVVFKARDPLIAREVAIKTVPVGYGGDTERRASHIERLRREALAVGKLNHPNIVTIFDVGEEGDSFYIAMEYLKGKTLDRAIKGDVNFQFEQTAEILGSIASALDHAHAHEVIHRDIKPSNLFLLEDGTIKVTDFGIAKLPLGTLTAEGRIVGSPSYMSPEQVRGAGVSAGSDVFSLGVVLYIVLTGKKPFGGGEVPDIIYRIVHEEPPPPSKINPAVPKNIDDVVSKALEKDPGKRFKSAGEFALAFENAVAKPRPKKDEATGGDEASDSATSEERRMPFDMDRYREKESRDSSNIDRVFQEITTEIRSFRLNGNKKKRKKR